MESNTTLIVHRRGLPHGTANDLVNTILAGQNECRAKAESAAGPNDRVGEVRAHVLPGGAQVEFTCTITRGF